MPAGCTASGSASAAAAATAAAGALPPVAAAAPHLPGAPSISTSSTYSIPYYDTLPLGLPNPTVLDHGTAGVSTGAALTAGRSRYLCYFVHRHLEFRLPEVESLAQAVPAAAQGEGPPVVWEKPVGNRVRAVHALSLLLLWRVWFCAVCPAPRGGGGGAVKPPMLPHPDVTHTPNLPCPLLHLPLQLESPFWYVHLRGGDAAAAAVGGSCMLAKVLLEVWGEGETFEGLQAAVAAYSPEAKARWGAPDQVGAVDGRGGLLLLLGSAAPCCPPASVCGAPLTLRTICCMSCCTPRTPAPCAGAVVQVCGGHLGVLPHHAGAGGPHRGAGGAHAVQGARCACG